MTAARAATAATAADAACRRGAYEPRRRLALRADVNYAVRLVRLVARPANAAQEIFRCACFEGSELSLVLGVAILGTTLEEYGVTPDQMPATLIKHSATARRLLFDLDVPVGTLAERLRR